MAKLVFTQDQLESNFKVVDEGLYQIELVGFLPKLSSKKTSINYNPQFEIVGTTDGTPTPVKEDGKPIIMKYAFGGNSSVPNMLNDMCHCLGLPMEGDEVNGWTLPGVFDGIQHESDDIATWHPEKWEYKGPLLRRKGFAFLVQSEYNNNKSNKIKYFQCAISDCTARFPKIKHSTDLLKSKS